MGRAGRVSAGAGSGRSGGPGGSCSDETKQDSGVVELRGGSVWLGWLGRWVELLLLLIILPLTDNFPIPYYNLSLCYQATLNC